MKKLDSANSATAPSISLPIEKLGAPGVVTYLHVVPVFEGEKRPDEARLRDPTPRKFCVTARLAKSPDVQSNINFSFAEDAGDSMFAFPEEAAYLQVETHDGTFSFRPNAERRFSSVRFECTARNSGEARRHFGRTVGPALDRIAYVVNTPLHVVQVSVQDEVHHITSTEVVCPHPVVELSNGLGKVFGQLVPVYAMYREAVNATSPFYKFFCFFKIMEGLLKPLRAKLYEEAKVKGIDLPAFQAKVPEYQDMPDEQKPYAGKSITRFFENYLSNRFRNAMAHFISDEGAVLNVNEVDAMEMYSSVVHIADLCCRELISHFEACVEALEKGRA